MESAWTPGGPSRALPRATPAGATRSPSRPVPSQPDTSNSTAGVRAVLSGTVAREAHTHGAASRLSYEMQEKLGLVPRPDVVEMIVRRSR